MKSPQSDSRVRLLMILHRAFVEVRNLALAHGCDPIAHLADTFETIPELMTKGEEAEYETIRAILREYQTRRAPSAYDYLSMLETDCSVWQPAATE
jgi:hypothetical protein